MIFAERLTVAKKINNYELDATSGILWVDTTHFKVVVPAGKRWFVIGGNIYRTQVAVCSVYAHDTTDNILTQLAYHGSATGHATFPEVEHVGAQRLPLPLDAGEYIQAVLTVAQDASAYGACMILEVEAE